MSVESQNSLEILAKEFSSIILKNSVFTENEVMAIEFLFIATMQGHQCVTLEEKKLLPHPSLVCEESVFDEEKLRLGFLALDNLLKRLSSQARLLPLIKWENNFYLQKSFFAEQNLIRYVSEFIQAPLTHVFSETDIHEAAFVYSSNLNKEQYQAVVSGLMHNMHILSGGPGTGKSYTVFYLLQTYLDLCFKKNIKPKILVIAPTGKATSVLHQRLISLKQQATIDIATVHKALKTAFRKNSNGQELYGYDFIVMDEASMVDMSVYEVLCQRFPQGSRVVFMGDHYQLPPIESSMVFHHLLKCLPHSLLSASRRVDNPDLLQLGEKIKEQDSDFFEGFIQKKIQLKGVAYIEYPKEEPLAKIFETAFQKDVASGMFLTPIKHGVWGVESLNAQRLIVFKQGLDEKIPILVTKNQYDLEIFNGDIGYLHAEENSVVSFFSSEGEKKIPLCLIHEWTYAFALTIHKSQGSEYDHVILFLPSGSESFGKELLYTAVTRARHMLTIFAVEGVLLNCLKKNAEKHAKTAQKLSAALIKEIS
jgi:exodeoxyribonuclease V alpha subunit